MVISVTANSIYLKWLEPLHANGPIGGYRVYFMHNNYTDVRTFKIDSTVTNIKFNLTRLSKFIYKFLFDYYYVFF